MITSQQQSSHPLQPHQLHQHMPTTISPSPSNAQLYGSAGVREALTYLNTRDLCRVATTCTQLNGKSAGYHLTFTCLTSTTPCVLHVLLMCIHKQKW
jgi:hypothetical protein